LGDRSVAGFPILSSGGALAGFFFISHPLRGALLRRRSGETASQAPGGGERDPKLFRKHARDGYRSRHAGAFRQACPSLTAVQPPGGRLQQLLRKESASNRSFGREPLWIHGGHQTRTS
jgi:hypothetical protein